MKKTIVGLVALTFLLSSSLAGCRKEEDVVELKNLPKLEKSVDISPRNWPEEDLKTFTELNNTISFEKPLVKGKDGMVSVTSNALAARAGQEALNSGGTAADAAISTALSQVALSAGSYVSYAGVMQMIYYDAKDKKTYSINGEYNIPENETDPLTIPKENSGRTALVPGFFAAIDEAHKKFGKLRFEDLFDSAIYFADEGIPVNSELDNIFETRKNVLTRIADTRDIFIKPDGTTYKEGDILKQPVLANTLRNVADQGVEYIYEGEWARNFVDTIQSEGGKITLKDMDNYKAIVKEALETSYGDYTLQAAPSPSAGGMSTLLGLKALEKANLSEYGHYTKSPTAFKYFTSISDNAASLGYLNDFQMKLLLKSPLYTKEKAFEDKYTEKLWSMIKEGKLKGASVDVGGSDDDEDLKHSAAIVTRDKWGNMAAVVHTINTVWYGDTGITVGGITIPDSAAFQQEALNLYDAGDRLPSSVNPMIVLKDNKPYMTSSSMNTGLYPKTLQAIHNVLEYDMSIEDAQNSPVFYVPQDGYQQIDVDLFPENFIEELNEVGVKAREVTSTDGGYFKEYLQDKDEVSSQEWQNEIRSALDGYWVAIKIGEDGESLEGIASKHSNGAVSTN